MRIRRPSEWAEKTLDLSPEGFKRLTEIVDGLMLGDGHLLRQGGLRLEQSHVRRGWVENVQQRLVSLRVSSTLDEVTRPARFRKDGRLLPPYTGCSLRVPAYAELRILRQRWYPNGVKCVPEDVRLTAASVADWVSGDGTGTTAGGLILCTDGFTEQDVEHLICRLRETFGVRARTVFSGGGRPKIGVLRKDDVLHLRDILLPHMSACCTYKFQHARAAQKRGALSESEVRDIRARYEAGVVLALLATEYGLSRSAINNIGMRKVYKWVS